MPDIAANKATGSPLGASAGDGYTSLFAHEFGRIDGERAPGWDG
jgi:hypothetical protein